MKEYLPIGDLILCFFYFYYFLLYIYSHNLFSDIIIQIIARYKYNKLQFAIRH